MKPPLFSPRSRRAVIPAAFAAALLAGLPARATAAVYTWKNLSGNWSVAGNWLENAVPFSDPTNELIFGGSDPGYTSTDDLGFALTLNLLRLNSSVTTSPQTLVATNGSSLTFVANGGTNPTLLQQNAGAFVVDLPMALAAPTTFNGTGGGLVTLLGPISGASTLGITAGNWVFSDVGSTWSGATTISGGATVELKNEATGNAGIDFTGSAATGILGTNNTVTLNGGTLKFTTQGTGSLVLGANRVLAFGANGGTVSMLNSNPSAPTTSAGHIASGDLALTLNSTAAAPAVFQFNGGQAGLSTIGTPQTGNIDVTGNVLRFRSITGTGPLRIEVTNGAGVRGGAGVGAIDSTIASPTTVRGVVGGDPTSGPAGTVSSGISLNTGRFLLDYNRSSFTGGLTFEGAVQVTQANRTTALDGNLVIAGTASGRPGYVTFTGRGTGTGLTSTINAVGASTAGQNLLYLGENTTASSLTVQGGGTAVFDARTRIDQGNSNGVLMVANTTLQAGGVLRIGQSISNFSAVTGLNTTANVGDIILRNDVIGQGSTGSEAVLEIQLPAPNAGGTTANGTPTPLAATAPAAGARPFGGLVAESTHDLVINGTGFGGLRVNTTARPDRLFSATGAAGGAATPDPTSNLSKINDYLTAARFAAVTGSGGYLTAAPAGATWTVPNAEWASGVTVGLRVVDHNASGLDVQFDPAKTTWGHNLAVDAGAELSLGASPFTLTAGTLQGAGTVSGAGGLTVASGAAVSPGFSGIGTLTVGSLTLNGALLEDFAGAATGDLLSVNGNLTLGSSSAFTAAPGSTFSGNYTLLNYAGTLTGTFGSVTGLPLGYTMSYAVPGQVRLVFSTVSTKTWNGTPGNVWSTNAADANWQGPAAFSDGDVVVFDDTAAGSTSVTVSGLVQPGAITVNNSTKAYVLNATGAANTVGGSAPLTKSGTSSLTLNGAFTYGGGTTITGGSVTLGNNDALPNVGLVTVGSGGTLNLNGKTDTIGALSVTGTVTAGTLTVGGLTLETGASMAANLILNGNVTGNGTAGVSLPGTVNLNGARTFTVASGTVPELTLAGVVSNGTLVKAGPGQLLLGVANSYAGGTTVTAGTVKAGVAGAIPDGALVINGGTADLSGFAYTATSLTGTGGALAMGGGALTLNTTTDGTFAGSISGAGTTVTKLGGGVQTLTGASSFSGGLTVNAGRVNLNGTTAAGTGAILVGNGGSLQAGAIVGNSITLAGGTLSGGGATNVTTGVLNVTSPSSILLHNRDSNAASDVIILSTLSGSGDLTVTANASQANADAGVGFRLRGTTASTYTGTITVGAKAKVEIQMANDVAPNPGGQARITLTAGTSTGELGGTYPQFQARLAADNLTYPLNNNVAIAGTGYVNYNAIGGANTVAQFQDLSIGDGQIFAANKNDSINRTVAFSTVTLTGGTAEFRAFDPGFGAVATTARGGANIRLGAIGESLTSAGAGVIFKAGTGYRNEIVGVSSYGGTTQVGAGTLRIAATGSLASSSRLTLAAAGKLDVTDFGATGYGIPAPQTLAGTGDWDGRLLQSGSLEPGLGGLGTLTGDDLTLNGNAPLKFELSGVDNTSDRLALTGAFDKGTAGAFTFNFGGTGLSGQTYTLVQFASTSFSAANFTYTNLTPGLSAVFQMSGTDLQLAVIPEPAAAASLLSAAGLLAGLGQFRRRAGK